MTLFKSFRTLIILRLILCVTFGMSATYIITQTPFWLASLWLYLFFIISIYELIRFLERVKSDLSSFLIGIQQNDFSGNYNKYAKDKYDIGLYTAFRTITNEFQKLRKEKESNYHFLQAVVEHSTVPMLGFKEGNEVILMNEAAKSLFRKPFLKNINALHLISSPLRNLIEKLQSGEKELIKVAINNELLNLSVSAKELKLSNISYKLVSFQNIKVELDEKELESWQKLMRVLTHEIKNSVIPIATLTEAVNQIITDERGHFKDLSTLNNEDLGDLQIGIKTIEKRSRGLVSFVGAYSKLIKIQQPKRQEVNIKDMIENIVNLLKTDLKKNAILITTDAQDIQITLDPELIEQVLINLIKNASEALNGRSNGQIKISSVTHQEKTIISVKDNGPGMDQKTLENIFIPFFTTKKEGSGIGLSLSRQIMKAHGGTLHAHSKPEMGSEFYLVF